jgi:PDZ domain-containing protein
MARRRVSWWWILALALLAAVVAWFVPTGDVAYVPGITGNLRQMVQVAGARRSPPGRLLMVAIGIVPVNALLYFPFRWNAADEVLPAASVLGGTNMQEFLSINLAMMNQSQMQAAVDGERLAGLDARVVALPGAEVEGVLANSPAVGRLQPGDRILAVDGRAVSLTSLRARLAGYHIGQVVHLTVARGRRQTHVAIRLYHLAGDPSPAIGVAVGQGLRYVLPRRVTFHVSNIGGPSAGMMFALEIYQQITGRNLSRGRVVAGTGELGPDGSILPIGGVGQKVATVAAAGARLFLVPRANYPKAVRTAHLLGLHLTIRPVSTLRQALDILTASS